MSEINRFELYEKLYFHEVEAREKIASRLQIPLALILSIISVYSVMIKGTNFLSFTFWNVSYLVFLGISIFTFVVTLFYFTKGFYGHTYEMIPSASDSEKYYKTLVNTYKNYDDSENLIRDAFKKYLFDYYAKCSSNNTNVNDERSKFLHKCNTYLILTAIPLVVSFLIFSMAGVNRNSDDKEYMVRITTPVSITDSNNPPNVNEASKSNLIEVESFDKLKELVDEQREKGRESTTTATSTPDKGN